MISVSPRGSTHVSFRLSEEDLSVLRATVNAGATISDVIRQRLTGRGPLAGIPWECLQLDKELVDLERKARSEVLRQPDFLTLLRTPEEQIAEWERELAAAKNVTRKDGLREWEKAQRTIADLEPLLKNLRDLQERAKPLIAAKAIELKKAAGLGPVADVPGGALQRAIETLVAALNHHEELNARYRLVHDEPEIAAKLADAAEKVEKAKADLESLVARYQAALAERKRLQEEKEKALRAEKERALGRLKPTAEEAYRVAKDLAALLDEIRSEWASHPKLAEAVTLAQRLNELNREFGSLLSKAGEGDWYGRPSRPVEEMLAVVRGRSPIPENPTPPNVISLLAWLVTAWPKVGGQGLPMVEQPPVGGQR